ncbi:UNVERIFIED_CONTAM: LanC-like protein 3-like protein [Trichonephila clavipes]
MAAKRFFKNKLSDSVGAFVEIPKADIKNLSMNYAQYIFSQQTVTADDCDGGLYVGLSGISYMCYYLSQHEHFIEKKQEFLEKSLYYMIYALEDANHPRNRHTQTAFLLGGCGSYAVAAALMNALGKEKECQMHLQQYISLADRCMDPDYLGNGSDELLVGRAGYLSGVLFVQKVFGPEVVPEQKIDALCSAIIQSGVQYSKKYRSPCPLMYAYYKTEYLGAAHGLSGILQMLLSFPSFLQKRLDAEQLIKESVDYFLTLQLPSGNFPCAMDEVGNPRSEAHELVHWCHGAPDYSIWKKFHKKCCVFDGQSLLKVERGKVSSSLPFLWGCCLEQRIAEESPGICHGIAGNGYVFLLLYRLTDHHKHLHRAIQFANFLTSDEFKRARTPDRPLSLYEGLAGTVCFLADLLQPEKAHFPFFDVF